MLRSLLRDKLLLSFFLLVVLIKLFSLNEDWVEQYYANGFYPVISSLLRILLGWLPFSFGDLFYLGAFLYLVLKTWKFLKLLKKRQVKEYLSHVLVRKLLRLVLGIYLLFNILWGLNYNRRDIAVQLGLDLQPYTVQELDTLTSVLHQRLNEHAALIDPLKRAASNTNKWLFKEGIAAYALAEQQNPVFRYRHPSIKPSMFTGIGHFFGFTGYYNPFSGEAQIKTTAPVFIKPFVVTHEMAHQLGYAKENEANLVSFLVTRTATNEDFRYSIYYDMYLYSISELSRMDSLKAKDYTASLHPQVKQDNEELKEYLRRSQNPVEPYISAFYNEYLKLNNQPKGKMTYHAVVAWLIAYQKKYGRDAI